MTPHLIEGFVKTVRASEVETWAGYGWVVVGTYQDTILKMVTELVDSPLGSSIHSGQSYQDANGLWQSVPMGKVAVIKQLPETVTFFVLQKDTESALADMSAKLKASNEVLNAKLAEAAKKITELRDMYDKKEMEKEKEYRTATDLLKKSVKETEAALNQALSGREMEILNKQIKRLEADLAQAQKDLDEAQQERFGVRRVDLTEDVA